MLSDMNLELFIRMIAALAGGCLLATPAIRLWKWNSTLSLRGAAILIIGGAAALFMASSKTGFLEAQGLQIQLTHLKERVDGLGSLAATAKTAVNDTSTLQQSVGSLQTKVNLLEDLGKNIAKAQLGQAARLETLLSSLYFQQVTPQGQAAVYIDPNTLKNLQAQ